jgi:hypothetical protein
MTDIQNFCDRNSVTHNKNQNANSNVFDIHVKNSNVGLEIPYVPGLISQEEFFLFLILRKNCRGITFFASFETPISVIKKSFPTQRKT